MHLIVKIVDPGRDSMTWEERWEGADKGLIAAWERGREKSGEDLILAAAARRGELVALPWKGGVERATKQTRRYGTLLYLAMWQGLRKEKLDIDMECETALTCSRTGMTITYTPDASKYSQQE
jgi:hypothetical protein